MLVFNRRTMFVCKLTSVVVVICLVLNVPSVSHASSQEFHPDQRLSKGWFGVLTYKFVRDKVQGGAEALAGCDQTNKYDDLDGESTFKRNALNCLADLGYFDTVPPPGGSSSSRQFHPDQRLSKGWFGVLTYKFVRDDISGGKNALKACSTSNRFSDLSRESGFKRDALNCLAGMGYFDQVPLPDGTLPGWGGSILDTTTETQQPDKRVVPNPDGRRATGRCSPVIGMGTYNWEWCAWGNSADPEMNRRDMERLVAQVWNEVESEGKPNAVPSLEEKGCTGGSDVLGCYNPGTNTIRLETGFTLSTLLHELAHALVSQHDSMDECGDEWTHLQQGCWHGEWYRCAADSLYQWYANIAPAGVCGTPPDIEAGDWWMWERSETEWGVIHSSASVFEEDYDYDTRTGYRLNIRCDTNYVTSRDRVFTIFLSTPYTLEEGDYTIHYRFSAEKNRSETVWYGREGREHLWPNREFNRGSFLDRFQGSDRLYMSVEYSEGTDRFVFDLGDSPPLSILRAACSQQQ